MDAELKRIIIPLAIAVASAVILLAARAALIAVLHKWAKRTETRLDDIIIGSLRAPSIYWALAIGAHAGVSTSELPPAYINYISKGIYVIVILSVTVAVANLSGSLLSNYVQRMNIPMTSTGLANGILKGTVFIVGVLVVLSVLGISIAPLVTALGVGGLAVALALQDTLANLFAGIHILVERSVRVGDFIRLESGQEGYVADITWRTTRIRMLTNNMVVIPNNKLSQSVVTNYMLPDKTTALSIPVSVGFSANPGQIEGVLVDEAKRAAQEVPGLLSAPEPSARLIPGFGASSLDFTLTCHVREFSDQYHVQHEIRKRIFERFKREGIEMPFPQRTVHIKRDNDA